LPGAQANQDPGAGVANHVGAGGPVAAEVADLDPGHELDEAALESAKALFRSSTFSDPLRAALDVLSGHLLGVVPGRNAKVYTRPPGEVSVLAARSGIELPFSSRATRSRSSGG
jgi:hypothetical protein